MRYQIYVKSENLFYTDGRESYKCGCSFKERNVPIAGDRPSQFQSIFTNQYLDPQQNTRSFPHIPSTKKSNKLRFVSHRWHSGYKIITAGLSLIVIK